MARPAASVIIPSYNAAGTLRDAIDSIRLQGLPLQIIVVDDGSTDDTRSLLRDMSGVAVVHQSNQGVAAARNRALQLVESSMVAFLDADDVWTPGSLETRLALLERDEGAGVVLGMTGYARLDAHGQTHGPVVSPRLMLAVGAALVRRQVFDAHGCFDPALRSSEDVDWFLRIRDCGVRILTTSTVVQVHRRHGGNMTRGKDLRELQFLEAVQRSLKRRRSGGASA